MTGTVINTGLDTSRELNIQRVFEAPRSLIGYANGSGPGGRASFMRRSIRCNCSCKCSSVSSSCRSWVARKR